MIDCELRLIHLAGSQEDAALLAHAAQDDRMGPVILGTAFSLGAGLELLARQSYDAALVSLALPDCGGLAVFEQIHQAAPALPIVVYGSGEEDEAGRRAVQSGAYDFLAANRGELAMAPRILRHVVQRHALAARLHERDAYDAAHFVADLIPKIITTLPGGEIIDVNHAFCSLLGYAREDVIGRTTVEIGLWAIEDDRNLALHLLRTEGRVRNREFSYRTRTGLILTMRVSFEPVVIDGRQCLISTALDVTEFKRVVEQLQASERTLRLFVEYAPAAVAMFDRNMVYLAASRRFLTDYVPGRQPVIGRSHYEVFPGLPQHWIDSHERCLAGASEVKEEDRFVRADGSEEWVHWEIYPWFEPSGVVGGLVLFSEIITGRKETEWRLAKLAERLDLATRSAHMGIWDWDIRRDELVWDDQMYRLYGLKPGEFQGAYAAWLNGVYPDDRETVNALVGAALRGENAYDTEFRVRWPDGSIHWLKAIGDVVFDADGMPLRMIGVNFDITEHRLAVEKLRESEEYLRLAYEAADIGIWRNDLSTGMAYLDERARVHYGLAVRDVPLGELLAHVYPEDADRLRNEIAVATGPSGVGRFYTEYRVVHPDGSVHWLAIGVRVLFEGEGAARHAVIGYGTTLDITERKQAEINLRRSEELYRSLMESLDSVIATVDADGHILYMNDIAADQLGGKPDAFIGKTFFDLFPEVVARRQLEHVGSAIAEDKGAVYEAENYIQGKPRWYRTSIQPIHDEQGNVVHALINSTDIHELKVAQHELIQLNLTLEARVRERTAEVQDLYDNAPTGYHSLDATGRYLLVNQTELDWLGYTHDEVIGQPFSNFITPAGNEIFKRNFPNFKRRGWIRDLEFDMIRKDGSTFPILLNATGIRDETGAYVMSRSTIFDNTDRHAAEVALRESEAQNRLLFEESPEAILLISFDGRIMRANRAYAELTKHPLDKLIGHSADELGIVSRDLVERLSISVSEALSKQVSVTTAEFRLHCADDTVLDVESRIFLVGIQGRDHILVTTRDVTTHRLVEERLRMANMELERAMRMKDEFLANMSHELRTPLTGVLALSEVLLEETFGPLGERQVKALQNIEASGRHLLSLINDLLDISRIEAGRADLQKKLVSADEVCRSSLIFIKEMAHRKEIRLTYRNRYERAKVEADERRLRQMLVNLLSNAVKFTGEGGQVWLDVIVDREKSTVEFAVQDTGPGIAPKDQARLFQPFSQLDSTLSRQFEGSGLGLALVKRLAEQHGGSVRVDSTGIPGQGCRFSIILPNLSPESDELPASDGKELHPDRRAVQSLPTRHRILLAEDNPVTCELLSDYLTSQGYGLDTATNGRDAIELAHKEPPDLFLIDIQLPMLDGIEVIRRLRSDVRFRSTPIIALTALAMPGDRDRCLSAGATEYLSKPFRMADLAALAGKLLRQPAEDIDNLDAR